MSWPRHDNIVYKCCSVELPHHGSVPGWQSALPFNQLPGFSLFLPLLVCFPCWFVYFSAVLFFSIVFFYFLHFDVNRQCLSQPSTACRVCSWRSNREIWQDRTPRKEARAWLSEILLISLSVHDVLKLRNKKENNSGSNYFQVILHGKILITSCLNWEIFPTQSYSQSRILLHLHCKQ